MKIGRDSLGINSQGFTHKGNKLDLFVLTYLAILLR